jgi:hypothetical protein
MIKSQTEFLEIKNLITEIEDSVDGSSIRTEIAEERICRTVQFSFYSHNCSLVEGSFKIPNVF